MEKNKFWCATGVSIKSTFILDTYINDLPEGIISICKIFANDTSLFSKVINTINSENTLNAALESISNWAYQWKMQFSPDRNKQANEVIFPRKSNIVSYPPIIFNNNSIAKCLHQKHFNLTLGLILNIKQKDVMT